MSEKPETALKVSKMDEKSIIKELQTVKSIICPEATDDEMILFAKQCSRTGLDPFQRQIFLIKRGGKPTIQTSIDGFRLIAERSGQYAGNDDYIFDPEFTNGKTSYPRWAKATIYKMIDGQKVMFAATARWAEYKQEYNGKLSAMWQKFPSVMLGKCAEALALRKAFPNDLSGIYTDTEMDQSDSSGEVVINKTKKETPKKKEVKKLVTEDQISELFELAEKKGIFAGDFEAQVLQGLKIEKLTDMSLVKYQVVKEKLMKREDRKIDEGEVIDPKSVPV